MAETIRQGAWLFTPTPTGLTVERELNAVQTEYIGVWPWQLIDRLANAKPAEKTK